MTGTDELVGQVVDQRYRIEAELGRGAMGMVYRARHVRVGREVAIKVLHAHLVCDPAMVLRFEREAAIAARLAHRNVVGVLDVAETAQRHKLIVLELARGDTLAQVIARGPLAGRRVVNLAGQLLCGLAHAHGAGLVHRDLKPDNVIVERDDRGDDVPRIVDFGIAVLRDGRGAPDPRLTDRGIVLGTPPYMAPEQIHGDPPDPRTDLFALGVMVYEMLSGRQPFSGSAMEIMLANTTRDPPAIAERAGVVVDPRLEAFARRLMARCPDARYPSAQAALAALAEIDRSAAIRPLRAPRASRCRRRAVRASFAGPTQPCTMVGLTQPLAAPVASAAASGTDEHATRRLVVRPWWRWRRSLCWLIAIAAFVAGAVLGRGAGAARGTGAAAPPLSEVLR